jgi:ribosomal-protein-alanine N-acetyltransferase
MRPLSNTEATLFAEWEKERPYPWTEKNFLDTLGVGPTKTFVWGEPSHPYAFAVVQRVDNEAYLQNLFVKPPLRNKGWGEKIVRQIMIWSRNEGANRLTLDVDPANKAAVRLYEKVGFQVLERRKKSYPRGEDALVMRISL